MIIDNEKLVHHMVNQLKTMKTILKKDGFAVMESKDGASNILIALLDVAEITNHLVGSQDSDMDQYKSASEVAEKSNYGIASTISRESFLISRDFNHRIELGADIYPLTDLYTSEISGLASYLNVDVSLNSAKNEEIEKVVRLVEKFTGQVSGDGMFQIKGALVGTLLDSPEVASKLDEYARLEIVTRQKASKNVISLKLRDPGLGLVK